MSPPIDVFVSYAPADEALWKEFERHLAILKRDRVIRTWGHHSVGAGEDWRSAVGAHLSSAHIIILFLSADFFASDQRYDVDVENTLARMDAGDARVFPIRIGPYDWENIPFEHLRALPSNGIPVTKWPIRDDAWAEIARQIRIAFSEINGPCSPLCKEPVGEDDLDKGPASNDNILARIRDFSRRSSYGRDLTLLAAWFGGIGLSLCLSFDLRLVQFEGNLHGALVRFTTASAIICGALSTWLGIGCLFRREGLGVLVWWVLAPALAVSDFALLIAMLPLIHIGYFASLHTIILGSVAPGLLTAAALGSDHMRRI
ncbi:toll/interleukin-1 receptor domain-containing protein [Sorangium sp. So ce269]